MLEAGSCCTLHSPGHPEARLAGSWDLLYLVFAWLEGSDVFFVGFFFGDAGLGSHWNSLAHVYLYKAARAAQMRILFRDRRVGRSPLNNIFDPRSPFMPYGPSHPISFVAHRSAQRSRELPRRFCLSPVGVLPRIHRYLNPVGTQYLLYDFRN